MAEITRQEAIDTLKRLKTTHMSDFGWDLTGIKALDMAVKALEQEPKITAGTIQAILDFLENNNSEWGEVTWKDENGKGFWTDQGYFIQGLKELREYLKESEV